VAPRLLISPTEFLERHWADEAAAEAAAVSDAALQLSLEDDAERQSLSSLLLLVVNRDDELGLEVGERS
jgi:hypothetical protein